MNHDAATNILLFLFDFTTKCEKMHFGDSDQRIHIILLKRVFLARRRPEIIVGIPMAHHNVSYRWFDRELRSFEVQEWIYGGAWKLAADLAPSGGIHSCTSESHNLRIETSGRYGITQRFYPMSISTICISERTTIACTLEEYSRTCNS